MRKATFDELSRQKRYRLKKIITKVKGMTNHEGKKSDYYRMRKKNI